MEKNIKEIKYFLLVLMALLLITSYCAYTSAKALNQIQRDIATDKANHLWENSISSNK